MLGIIKKVNIILFSGLPGISSPLLACPDMQGSYNTENNGTQIYLHNNGLQKLNAVIDIPGHPLQAKTAVFVSEEDRNAQPYQALPECTLSIDGFGYLLPHMKGKIFRLHFDSQDYEKVFNTDYILKLSDIPAENIGVNKTASTIPDKALTALNKH
ncbi:hypothetical protein ACSPAH_04970 [Buttiauxella agrestis]